MLRVWLRVADHSKSYTQINTKGDVAAGAATMGAPVTGLTAGAAPPYSAPPHAIVGRSEAFGQTHAAASTMNRDSTLISFTLPVVNSWPLTA